MEVETKSTESEELNSVENHHESWLFIVYCLLSMSSTTGGCR